MRIIRTHLAQMKLENPAEYKKLMQDYKNEDEFIREVLGLSETAFKIYQSTREETYRGSK